MTTGNPPLRLRIDDEARPRWELEAKRRKVSLEAFIRDCVESHAFGSGKRRAAAARVAEATPGGHKPFRPDFGSKIK